MAHTPSFNEITAIDESVLVAKLDAMRKAIAHGPEKGRSLELEVIALLRQILPAEYGLSSGFIAYRKPGGVRLSTQLDVIIYDAVRYRPLIQFPSCAVLPLEAVYGYVEVKAVLSSSRSTKKLPEESVERCLQKNRMIRQLRRRYFCAPSPDSPVQSVQFYQDWMLPRAYIFAFEPKGMVAADPKKLARRVSEYCKKLGSPTHLHGIFIAGHSFLCVRPINPKVAKPEDYYHVLFTTQSPLGAFKWSLSQALSRFPRAPQAWAADLEQYEKQEPKWTKENFPGVPTKLDPT